MTQENTSNNQIPSATENTTSSTVVATPPTDALGKFGVNLTAYHVGDFTGILGLVLTVIATLQARAAKVAAKEAAAAAIGRRDRLETTTKLTDLSNHLKNAREVFISDEWSRLPDLCDEIVSITVEIAATGTGDAELNTLMGSIATQIRRYPTSTAHFKDAQTLAKAKLKFSKEATEFVDKVNSVKHRKVKNGT